jgi:hypothetical protein
MRVPSTLVLAIFVLGAACGGEKKGARSPESNSDITETSSSPKEDMPPPPSKEGEGATTETHTGPGAAGGMLKLATMKVTPLRAGAKDRPAELQADGTVVIDGKPVAKIKGDQVDSVEGVSMVTIGVTGGLVGMGVRAGLKFEGDDVVGDDGLRLTVADDGTITASKDGKTEPLYRAEGGGASKRTALVVALLWMTIPATIGAPAPADTGKKKPAKK